MMMNNYIDPTRPLIDLHRHLDGSVRLETILELGLQHNLPLPAQDVAGLRPFVQVTSPEPDIVAFFKKFKWQVGILVDEATVEVENIHTQMKTPVTASPMKTSKTPATKGSTISSSALAPGLWLNHIV